MWVGGEGVEVGGGEADGLEMVSQVIGGESKRALAEPSAKVVAVMSEQVEDDQLAGGFENASCLGQRGSGILEIGEGEYEQSGINRCVGQGQCGEVRIVQRDVVAVGSAGPGGFEHGGSVIDGMDMVDMIRQGSGVDAGAAAQVGDSPVAGQQSEQGLGAEGLPVQRFPQAIPFRGGAGEKHRRVLVPFGEHGSESQSVLLEFRPVPRAFPGELPKLRMSGAELILTALIPPGGAFPTRDDPTIVGEQLEMA